MRPIPSRKDLAAITEAARAVVNPESFGFARALDDGFVSVFYAYPLGIGEYLLRVTEVPDVMLPAAGGSRQAGIAAMNAEPAGAVGFLLRTGGVQRVVSVGVPERDTPTRLWLGLRDPDPLTAEQLMKIEAIGEMSAGLLERSLSYDEAVHRR